MIKAVKIIAILIAFLIGLVLLYLSVAYVLSRITIEKKSEGKECVSIYILTNGVHTDIVVPIRNEFIDWSKKVKFENTQSKDTTFNYLALGWGDKGFYLETPEWADLKASVAFKAATGLGNSAMHATFYRKMKEDETCKRIEISEAQYLRLINFLTASFKNDADGNFIAIETDANYSKTDAFYEANGSYSLVHTCNTWANDALKYSGQRCCLWTPFDTGIFLKYE